MPLFKVVAEATMEWELEARADGEIVESFEWRATKLNALPR